MRLIAESLTKFADERHWSDDDYRIYYRLDSLADAIHVIFFARDFLEGEKYSNWVTVRNYLSRTLSDESGLLNYIGLVVMNLDEIGRGGVNDVEKFREYWTRYRRRGRRVSNP